MSYDQLPTLNTGIYSITNKVNGTVYIGKTGGKYGFEGRWAEHRRSFENPRTGRTNLHLGRAWKKYGPEAFKFEVLVQCPPINALLNAYEKHFIAEARANGKCYNQTDGGDGIMGCKSTPEARANISRGRKGMKFSAVHRKNIADAQAGKCSNAKRRHIQDLAKDKEVAVAVTSPDGVTTVYPSVGECCVCVGINRSVASRCLNGYRYERRTKWSEWKFRRVA